MFTDIYLAATKNAFLAKYHDIKQNNRLGEKILFVFPHDLLKDFDFLQLRYAKEKILDFASNLEAFMAVNAFNQNQKNFKLLSLLTTEEGIAIYEVQYSSDKVLFKSKKRVNTEQLLHLDKSIFTIKPEDIKVVNELYNNWLENELKDDTNFNVATHFQVSHTFTLSNLHHHFSQLLGEYITTEFQALSYTDYLNEFTPFKHILSVNGWKANDLITLNEDWLRNQKHYIWQWMKQEKEKPKVEVKFLNLNIKNSHSLISGIWYDIEEIFSINLDSFDVNYPFSLLINTHPHSSFFPIKSYLPNKDSNFKHGLKTYKMIKLSICLDHSHYLFLKIEDSKGLQKCGFLADISDILTTK